MDEDKTTNNNDDNQSEDPVSAEDLIEAISKDNAPEEPLAEDSSESEDMVAKCAEYKSGWLRATADYANLKKEMEQQRLDMSKYASAGMVNELLPIIDNLRKAAAHEPQPAEGAEMSPDVKQWVEGIKAVRQQFDSVLAKVGVEFIDKVEVEFDPNIHEAVMTKEVEGIEAGQVVEILEAGCKLHDRVIKPAKVAVSK